MHYSKNFSGAEMGVGDISPEITTTAVAKSKALATAGATTGTKIFNFNQPPQTSIATTAGVTLGLIPLIVVAGIVAFGMWLVGRN